MAVGPAPGEAQGLAPIDEIRIPVNLGRSSHQACDPVKPLWCWRAAWDQTPTVEVSSNGGETWRRDYEMAADELRALREVAGESCGGPNRIDVVDIAVLPTRRGPLVAAAASNAGLLLRSPDGS